MKKVIFRILSVFMIIVSIFPLTCITGAEGIVDNEDISMSVSLSENAQYIEFSVSIDRDYLNDHKNELLYLFAFNPYQTAKDISSLSPILSDITPKESFSLRVSVDENLLYCGFLLATKDKQIIEQSPEDSKEEEEDTSADTSDEQVIITVYDPITDLKYATDISNGSVNTYNYPIFSSKKGLGIDMFSDAQLCGVAHTVVNVAVNDYFTENSESSHSVTIDGETYYFDEIMVAILDHKIKVFSDAGINVFLNFILTQPSGSMSEKFNALYYEERNKDASYCAFNITTQEGYRLTRAAAEFFTSRYTKAERPGFAASYIIGYQIDSNRYTNSMGKTEIGEYVDRMSLLMRIFSTAAQKSYSESKIYVSLGNTFAPSDIQQDPMLDYAGKEILELLNENISSDGNFSWGISVNPYNADISSPDFWSESEPTNDFSSPYLTMKNISILSQLLSQPKFLFNSEKRSIIIGELGFSSGNGKPVDLTLQAAAYAYAYYKAEADESIDAFIYHRQIDTSLEPADFGLYSRVAGTTQTPAEQKDIYNVFKHIDTEKSEEITAFALPVIGQINWGAAVTGYSPSEQQKRTVITSNVLDADDMSAKHIKNDFIKVSTSTFYPSDNAYLAEYSNGVLKTTMYSLDSNEYCGISHVFEEGYNIEDPIIGIRLTTSANCGDRSDIMIRAWGKDKDGDDVIYEATAQINAGVGSELWFDISEFKESSEYVSGIKIWSRPVSMPASNDFNLTLEDIYTVSLGRGGGIVPKIIIVLLIIVAIVFLVLLIMFFRSSFGSPKREKVIHMTYSKRTLAKKRKNNDNDI